MDSDWTQWDMKPSSFYGDLFWVDKGSVGKEKNSDYKSLKQSVVSSVQWRKSESLKGMMG